MHYATHNFIQTSGLFSFCGVPSIGGNWLFWRYLPLHDKACERVCLGGGCGGAKAHGPKVFDPEMVNSRSRSHLLHSPFTVHGNPSCDCTCHSRVFLLTWVPTLIFAVWSQICHGQSTAIFSRWIPLCTFVFSVLDNNSVLIYILFINLYIYIYLYIYL